MRYGSRKFHSPLSKAKGLGPSHSGVTHWWLQRITSVPLIILLPWFVISLMTAMLSPDVITVANWFSSPINSLGTIAMLIAVFWHAKLGFQVVVEDYVHTPFAKYALLLLNNFAAFAFIIAGIACVLKLHLIDVLSFPT